MLNLWFYKKSHLLLGITEDDDKFVALQNSNIKSDAEICTSKKTSHSKFLATDFNKLNNKWHITSVSGIVMLLTIFVASWFVLNGSKKLSFTNGSPNLTLTFSAQEYQSNLESNQSLYENTHLNLTENSEPRFEETRRQASKKDIHSVEFLGKNVVIETKTKTPGSAPTTSISTMQSVDIAEPINVKFKNEKGCENSTAMQTETIQQGPVPADKFRFTLAMEKELLSSFSHLSEELMLLIMQSTSDMTSDAAKFLQLLMDKMYDVPQYFPGTRNTTKIPHNIDTFLDYALQYRDSGEKNVVKVTPMQSTLTLTNRRYRFKTSLGLLTQSSNLIDDIFDEQRFTSKSSFIMNEVYIVDALLKHSNSDKILAIVSGSKPWLGQILKERAKQLNKTLISYSTEKGTSVDSIITLTKAELNYRNGTIDILLSIDENAIKPLIDEVQGNSVVDCILIHSDKSNLESLNDFQLDNVGRVSIFAAISEMQSINSSKTKKMEGEMSASESENINRDIPAENFGGNATIFIATCGKNGNHSYGNVQWFICSANIYTNDYRKHVQVEQKTLPFFLIQFKYLHSLKTESCDNSKLQLLYTEYFTGVNRTVELSQNMQNLLVPLSPKITVSDTCTNNETKIHEEIMRCSEHGTGLECSLSEEVPNRAKRSSYSWNYHHNYNRVPRYHKPNNSWRRQTNPAKLLTPRQRAQNFFSIAPEILNCYGSTGVCFFCYIFLFYSETDIDPGACQGACAVAVGGTCGFLLGKGIQRMSEQTVICTELHRQGLMSSISYEADAKFGRRLEHERPKAMEMYRLLATPVVALMQRSAVVTDMVDRLSKPSRQHMEYIEGLAEEDNETGRILLIMSMRIFELLWYVREASNCILISIGAFLILLNIWYNSSKYSGKSSVSLF